MQHLLQHFISIAIHIATILSLSIACGVAIPSVPYILPRDPMLERYYAVVVCLSVRLSVTNQYYIKMAKCKITQTTPHNSRWALVLMPTAKDVGEIRMGHPKVGAKAQNTWGRLKSAVFDKYLAISETIQDTDSCYRKLITIRTRSIECCFSNDLESLGSNILYSY